MDLYPHPDKEGQKIPKNKNTKEQRGQHDFSHLIKLNKTF